MSIERAGIIVTNEIPNVHLEEPLSPADLERAKRIRWQYVLCFNRARSAPLTPESIGVLESCETAIAIIDALLAAQPTIN